MNLPNIHNVDDRFKKEIDMQLSENLSDDSARINFDMHAINKLKRNKATGPEGICNDYLIFAGPQLCVHLCLLFSLC